jgi:hypothetical protein
MNVEKVFKSKFGVTVVSIILGLGIAALFRSVCKDGKCVIIEGPPIEEVQKYYYKINDSCYKYEPVPTECRLV